jgi:hypothetical protein
MKRIRKALAMAAGLIGLSIAMGLSLAQSAGDAEVYFVANRTDRAQEIQSRFRVDGKEAELWRPDTGVIEPADYTIADGHTTVPLHLKKRESVFVVFRISAESPSRAMPPVTATTLATMSGPWDVSFRNISKDKC